MSPELREKIVRIARHAIEYLPPSDPGDDDYDSQLAEFRGDALEQIIELVKP